MFERKNRLSKNKDFDNVWQKGRSSFDSLIGVKALSNQLDFNRFGILVGLKVDRKAVKRNYLKRVLREAAKRALSELKTGFDIVIISLPAAKGKKPQVLEKSLKDNLKKLKILP